MSREDVPAEGWNTPSDRKRQAETGPRPGAVLGPDTEIQEDDRRDDRGRPSPMPQARRKR